MRILFTSQSVYSHLVPLVLPTALAVRRLGHEVAVAAGPDVIGLVEQAGLRALPLPDLPTVNDAVRGPREDAADGPAWAGFGAVTRGVTPELFARAFIRTLGASSARQLIPQLQEWRPDIVVRETTEFGGYLAAEFFGIPLATIDISPLCPLDNDAVLAEVNAQRDHLGLGPVADPLHVYGGFRVGAVPGSFYPSSGRPDVRHYRPPVPDPGALDRRIADAPTERPLVLVSFGSIAPPMMGADAPLMRSVVSALAGMPVTGVVVTGTEDYVARWQGPRPDNVILTAAVPQPALLSCCDAFLTHGGFNGVRESLAAGVPMVAVPLFADHELNARRLVELGVGRALNAEAASPAALRTALSDVLGSDAYRRRARRFQRETLALEPLDQAAADLVDAVTVGV